MSRAIPVGSAQPFSPEPGMAAAVAQRMPHLLLGCAALVLASWWVLARGGQQQPPMPPPMEDEQPARHAAGGCDACAGCDCSGCDLGTACDCADCACDIGDLCSGCDIDCVAVPPGAMTHTFDAADRGAARGPDRPRCDRRPGLGTWASLGLLVPLAVMFWWRRRR